MQTRPAQAPLHMLRGCWARLKEAAGPVVRQRRLRRRNARIPEWPGPIVASPAPAVDPVALTILAVNRLGPATFRTVSLGIAVTVTVPDSETGDIFRAALSEMQKARATDRLIRIEVANETARPRVAAEA
ncbi:MAG TPA: hypothetical protein VMU87_21260 [Stellaceae bacterium]|nr:hypothetical protein [Stellaceae bacterium]